MMKKYKKLDIIRNIITTILAICIIPLFVGIFNENIILLIISGNIFLISIIAYYKIRERILNMQSDLWKEYKYLGITEDYDFFEIQRNHEMIKVIGINPLEAEIIGTEISIKDAEKMFNLVV